MSDEGYNRELRRTADEFVMTTDEIIDRIRWEAITGGIYAEPDSIERMLADLDPARRRRRGA